MSHQSDGSSVYDVTKGCVIEKVEQAAEAKHGLFPFLGEFTGRLETHGENSEYQFLAKSIFLRPTGKQNLLHHAHFHPEPGGKETHRNTGPLLSRRLLRSATQNCRCAAGPLRSNQSGL